MYDTFAKLLQKNGVTSYRVAKETNIAQSTFSDWKSGKSVPGTEKMKKIADYFGVTVDYLITGEQKEVSNNSPTSPDTISITPDDFTYAMYNEGKTLTPEKKQALIQMAQLFNEDLKKEDKE